MTWYVKMRRIDGAVTAVLCDEPAQVLSNLADFNASGREAWIEDVDGRKISLELFKQTFRADDKG